MQSGGTRDRGVNIVSVPTKSGRLATMQSVVLSKGTTNAKTTVLTSNTLCYLITHQVAKAAFN